MSPVDQTSSPASSNPADPHRRMRHGIVWFIAGALVLILTHYFRRAGQTPLGTWGPLLPMFAGAWGVVVGIEGIVGGWRAARARGKTGVGGSSTSMLLVIAGVVIAVELGVGWVVWEQRAPYWEAVRGLSSGRSAEQKLRAIAERHAATTQSGVSGAAAVESWRQAAAQGAALRPDFEAALQGARRMAGIAGGSERTGAENDIRFYSLCLEWMNLYDSVLVSIAETSMVEPPPEWTSTLEGIVDRIQDLPQGAGAGS